MKATIKSIAKACNMSTTSVSLVLNGKPNRISEASRALILETAARMHYSPNQLAVGLVKGRSRTIGLILSDISNIFLSEIAKTIEEEAKKLDFTIILGNTGDIGSRALAYIREFISKNVDGIIYLHASQTTPDEENEFREVISKVDIPFVMLDNDLADMEKIQRCILDNEKGGYMATEHLLKLGHRKIGSLLGPLGQCSVCNRLAGHKKALAQWKIPFEERLVFNGDFTLESGMKAMPYFMDQGVTAIFSYNDMMAYGLYLYARQHGIVIGKDVSVIGFDDIFVDELLEVPLTTIKQPRTVIAKKAIDLLLSMIKDKKEAGEPVVYQPELILRKSTSKISETSK